MRITSYQVAEQNSQLVETLGDEALGLLAAVERHLAIVAAPDISWGMQSVDTGFLRGISGRRRDFLVVEHAKFKEYRVLISARAYGSALLVTWMLTASPRLSDEVVRAMRLTSDTKGRHDIGAGMDIFSLTDLEAFRAITRLALQKAVAELTDDDENDENVTSSDTEQPESA